jgi:hypothetical protein
VSRSRGVPVSDALGSAAAGHFDFGSSVPIDWSKYKRKSMLVSCCLSPCPFPLLRFLIMTVFRAWIGDDFHPNVDPAIQARNRKIRRETINLRRNHFQGFSFFLFIL